MKRKRTTKTLTMDETLIFVDWDDTLFPTTWMRMSNIDIINPNTDTINMFGDLDRLIGEAIIKMRSQGSIVIVSNGEGNWLQTCLGVLPNFKEITETNIISMVSARDLFSDGNNFPEDWKMSAFKIFHDEHNPKTIISLGDSEAEHEAAIDLKDESNVVGSVKFIKDPTLNQIITQLEILTLLHTDFIEITADRIFHLREYM